MATWRVRAAAFYPSDLLASPAPVRLTLLAALCWSRTSEITDALVDLLIRLVLKIDTRAEKKVEKAIYAELKQVHARPASCSGSPGRSSSFQMRRCARRCIRWSGRRHCASWRRRPGRTSRCSAPRGDPIEVHHRSANEDAGRVARPVAGVGGGRDRRGSPDRLPGRGLVNWPRRRCRRTWPRCTPRCSAAGARSTCWTSSRRPTTTPDSPTSSSRWLPGATAALARKIQWVLRCRTATGFRCPRPGCLG